MITMALKGISWVGDMYQRFEDMCVEVDETRYKDTVKYVENQMWTVGETVKKFYSDVMLDLVLPSPLDPVKAESALLTNVHDHDVAICKKPKVDKEKEPESAASDLLVKDSDGAVAGDNSVNYRSCRSTTYSALKSCEKISIDSTDQRCTSEDFQSHCAELVSLNQATSVAKHLDSGQDSQCKSLSDKSSINASVTKDFSGKFSCTEPHSERDEFLCEFEDPRSTGASVLEVSPNEEDGAGFSGEMIEGCGSGVVLKRRKTRMPSSGVVSAGVNASSVKAVVHTMITDDVQNTVEVDKKLAVSDIGTSNLFFACEIKSNADGKQVLIDSQLSGAKLEESCVMVEKKDHSSKSALNEGQKSYKKKIMDGFFRRRRSKSKQKQEQLAASYEQNGQNLLSTTLMHLETQNSQTSESSESEWELL